VGHDPAQVTVFLIAVLATVVLGILVALIRPMVRKLFFFDWPPFYEWQQARRQLRRTDQWRVIWATRRSHPVSGATLADAQLAYARYRHASAQRSAQRLRRRRGRRVSLAAISVVFAGSWAVAAAAQSQQRITDSVAAAGAAMATLAGALDPWSVRRLIKRMARLQREIEDRHAQVPDQ
jgi:hypothetical protein